MCAMGKTPQFSDGSATPHAHAHAADPSDNANTTTDASGGQPPKAWRQKRKKLRKLSERGGVNTRAQMHSCRAHDISPSPNITFAANVYTPVLGAEGDEAVQSGPLASGHDLQQLVSSILQVMTPHSVVSGAEDETLTQTQTHNCKDLKWVTVANRASVESVVVLCVSDVTDDMVCDMCSEAATPRCVVLHGRECPLVSLKFAKCVTAPCAAINALLHIHPSTSTTTVEGSGKKRKKESGGALGEATADDAPASGPPRKRQKQDQEGTVGLPLQEALRRANMHHISPNRMKFLGFPSYPFTRGENSSLGHVRSTDACEDALDDVWHEMTSGAGSGCGGRLTLPSHETALRLLEEIEATPGLSPGYVHSYSQSSDRRRRRGPSPACAFLAVDCEMVTTALRKSELARVTMVAYDGTVRRSPCAFAFVYGLR